LIGTRSLYPDGGGRGQDGIPGWRVSQLGVQEDMFDQEKYKEKKRTGEKGSKEMTIPGSVREVSSQSRKATPMKHHIT